MTLKSCMAALAVIALAQQSPAVLVDNGDYTTDTRTGLDWLDMSFTHNLDYNVVLASITGGSLMGWRFATEAEFYELINSAYGSPYAPIETGFTPGYDELFFPAAQQLIALLGSTYGETFPMGTYFAYAVGSVDSSGLPNAHRRQFGYDVFEESLQRGFVRPLGNTEGGWDSPKDGASPLLLSESASFLVRETATVPDAGSAFSSLVAAILALLLIRNRVFPHRTRR